jgi:hypothetical protein
VAHVGQLNEPAHKYSLAKHLVGHFAGLPVKVGDNALIFTVQQCFIITAFQVVFGAQDVYKLFHAFFRLQSAKLQNHYHYSKSFVFFFLNLDKSKF